MCNYTRVCVLCGRVEVNSGGMQRRGRGWKGNRPDNIEECEQPNIIRGGDASDAVP